jgi:hypothetical protein
VAISAGGTFVTNALDAVAVIRMSRIELGWYPGGGVVASVARHAGEQASVEGRVSMTRSANGGKPRKTTTTMAF